MPANFDFQVENTLDFSGTGEQTAAIRLPKLNWRRMKIQITYKVVDSGIASGEDFRGAMTRMLIQTPGFVVPEPIDARRDELGEVFGGLLFESDQPVVNQYYDAQPTTNQDQESWFILDWGYNGAKMADNAVMNMTVNPVQEFGGASAFTATVRIALELGTTSVTEYVVRNPRSAATADDIPAPSEAYSSVLITTSTAADLTYIEVPQGMKIRNPNVVQNNWSQWIQEAALENDTNYYLIVPPVARTEPLRIECSTSEAHNVYYVSNLGWA